MQFFLLFWTFLFLFQNVKLSKECNNLTLRGLSNSPSSWNNNCIRDIRYSRNEIYLHSNSHREDAELFVLTFPHTFLRQPIGFALSSLSSSKAPFRCCVLSMIRSSIRPLILVAGRSTICKTHSNGKPSHYPFHSTTTSERSVGIVIA